MISEKAQEIEIKVIKALGCCLSDQNVEILMAICSDKPVIYDKPLYQDADSLYYEFRQSGVLLGFDLFWKLKFVCFYLVVKDDYHACTFNILPNVSKKTTKKEILEQFGLPNKRRSNKKISREAQFGEMVLGRIGDWLLYDKGTYYLRFEFNDETGKLDEISFSLKGYSNDMS